MTDETTETKPQHPLPVRLLAALVIVAAAAAALFAAGFAGRLAWKALAYGWRIAG